jgi:hypothetical protein
MQPGLGYPDEPDFLTYHYIWYLATPGQFNPSVNVSLWVAAI